MYWLNERMSIEDMTACFNSLAEIKLFFTFHPEDFRSVFQHGLLYRGYLL
jgi:hypothetical protein